MARIRGYVKIIRAPALAYTHASASKQAAQLSTRAPLTAKVHRTICLSFAMHALCLPDTLWLYTLVKNPGFFVYDAARIFYNCQICPNNAYICDT